MKKELVYRPDVLLLHYFASLLEVSISRNEFIVALGKQSGSNSLQGFSSALQLLGITTGFYKIAIPQLQKLNPPFITVFQEEKQRIFIAVENISDTAISYYTPQQGNIVATIEEIENKWVGVVLYPEATEIPINVSNDSELNEIQTYLKDGVKIIDNFFTEDECDFIISFVEQNHLFQRSPLAGTDGKIFYSEMRTSYTSIIKERENPTLSKIYQRVANLLNVPENHVEYLECVRYSIGQEFRPHWDTDETEDRKHTLVAYLNDDFEGGETYFPMINFKAKPKKGRVLYFKDRDDEQDIIPYSLHAGLPVNNGIKYACNIWVRNSPIPEKHYLETGILA